MKGISVRFANDTQSALKTDLKSLNFLSFTNAS